MVLINTKDMKSETAHFHMFKLISILFFIYFLYEVYVRSSIVVALIDTLTTWAMEVVSTPIPAVSILLGFPLKMFFDLPMYITYLLITGLSFFILYYYKHYDSPFIKHILETKMYSIFIISIVSSTILATLLDSGIEYVTEGKPMQHVVPMVIMSTLLIVAYIHSVHQLDMYNFSNSTSSGYNV